MATTIVRGRDRISELPKHVIELILESLPIQDAVRTSALSKKWRFSWTTISKLVFGWRFYYYLKRKKLHELDSIKLIITSILLLHDGPIVSFHVCLPHSPWHHMGHFLICLSKKGVKKLTVESASGSPRHMLPSHMYSCVELTHLEISHCNFNLPSSNFRGFPNLISLNLSCFKFQKKSFEDFITSCRLLESLTLAFYISGQDQINICCRSLKHMSVQGYYQPISIDAEGLETLFLYHSRVVRFDPPTKECSWSMVLGKVPKLGNLSLLGQFLARVGPMELPTPLNFLKVIKMNSVCFDNALEIRSALCLIRSAPALQELVIWSCNDRKTLDAVDTVSSSLGDGITLNCLKVVKFIFIRGLRSELEMIKSTLASSPSLEKIFIEVDSGIGRKDSTKIAKELMRFIRVSPKAEMIYSDLDECVDI